MVKTLAKSIREYKTPSILSPIFVSLEVIVECIMPLFIMRFIEEISNGKDSNSLPMEIILYYGGIDFRDAVRQICGACERGICQEPEKGYVLCDTGLFFLQYR